MSSQSPQLDLEFLTPERVTIRISGRPPVTRDFVSPLVPTDLFNLSWYVETYGTDGGFEIDDRRAIDFERRLPQFGEALFKAIFDDMTAGALFHQFYSDKTPGRRLTIAAQDPKILGLPWELMGFENAYLNQANPPISVRRRFPGDHQVWRSRDGAQAKDSLHILFVVSRPLGAGFIDPRGDPAAVLAALEEHAPDRFTTEFLRPGTFDALTKRLKDRHQPPVDIVHFDGHGYFDREGLVEGHVARLNAKPGQSDFHALLKLPQEAGPGLGYLLFETERGGQHFVSAGSLGQQLNEQNVSLVVLSACQSAMLASDSDEEEDEEPKSTGGGGPTPKQLLFPDTARQRAAGDDDSDTRATTTSADAVARRAQSEPLGTVAVRLTAAGIPAVLAMTHTVLVVTTQRLFGTFYAGLADGLPIGDALDAARNDLMIHPEKHEVLRFDSTTLEQYAHVSKLQDWFVPALYQNPVDDPPLLASGGWALLPVPPKTDNPTVVAGLPTEPPSVAPKKTGKSAHPPRRPFFGRVHELWRIERAFVAGVRRVAITGFGGQGKTELARELGDWLVRTGMFERHVFVDFSRWQGGDPIEQTLGECRSVLRGDLPHAADLPQALRQTRVLLTLDNLEKLDAAALTELLTSAAEWSECGGSRVLLTSRRPEFPHPAFRAASAGYQRLKLEGLGSKQHPDAALKWFRALFERRTELSEPAELTAPSRAKLLALFDRVSFHPLSIRVLSEQLKTRDIDEVLSRLETLLAVADAASVGPPAHPTDPDLKGTPRSLIASLQLSLDHLDEQSRQLLPRLGVFQGGAMEDMIVKVTGLGSIEDHPEAADVRARLEAYDSGDDAAPLLRALGAKMPDDITIPIAALDEVLGTEQAARFRTEVEGIRQRLAAVTQRTESLAGVDAGTWPELRRQLEGAALVEVESVTGRAVPFLKFHPTLAPVLWAELVATTTESDRQALLDRFRQHYYQLSCTLYDEDPTNPFATRAVVTRELPNLLHVVRASLAAADSDAVDFVINVNKFLRNFGRQREAEQLTTAAAKLGTPGSPTWFLARANVGEQLFDQGQLAEAVAVFQDILATLSKQPSYERCATFGRLGRCFQVGRQPRQAAELQRQALHEIESLEQTDSVKRLKGTHHTDLADSLIELGEFSTARDGYKAALEIVHELNDRRGEGVVLSQLGTLAMTEGNLSEAAQRWEEALTLFTELGETQTEATAWHQLGRVYQEARQWAEAERHYKEAARLNEGRRDLAVAAMTYNQLAIVTNNAGRPEAAEQWYRKAIAADRQTGQIQQLAGHLNNLADLLRTQSGRGTEARQHAEDALKIQLTLDPDAAQIWTTYSILAEIAAANAQSPNGSERPLPTEPHLADLRDLLTSVPPAEQSAAEASWYRRLAREAKQNFAGTRYELRRQWAEFILIAVAALRTDNPQAADALAQHQQGMRASGDAEWSALADSLDRLRAAPTTPDDLLLEPLSYSAGPILMAILQGLRNPADIADLLPEGSKE